MCHLIHLNEAGAVITFIFQMGKIRHYKFWGKNVSPIHLVSASVPLGHYLCFLFSFFSTVNISKHTKKMEAVYCEHPWILSRCYNGQFCYIHLIMYLFPSLLINRYILNSDMPFRVGPNNFICINVKMQMT